MYVVYSDDTFRSEANGRWSASQRQTGGMMFDNLRVGIKIALAFAVIVLLLAVGGVSWREAARSKERVDAFTNQASIAELVPRADASVLRARMASLRYTSGLFSSHYEARYVSALSKLSAFM